jgi:hypothetical protein
MRDDSLSIYASIPVIRSCITNTQSDISIEHLGVALTQLFPFGVATLTHALYRFKNTVASNLASLAHDLYF